MVSWWQIDHFFLHFQKRHTRGKQIMENDFRRGKCGADLSRRRGTSWMVSRWPRDRHLALSPDGSMLVYAAMEGREFGLWIIPVSGGKSIPLTVMHPGHNEGPSWSPDGKKIAFASFRSASGGIWLMEVNLKEIKMELSQTCTWVLQCMTGTELGYS